MRRGKISLLLGVSLWAAWFCGVTARAADGLPYTGLRDTGRINVRIDTSAGHMPISPYIYGLSAEGSLSSVTVYATKHSGAALSTYNWESNCANAGASGNNANDYSLIRGFSEQDRNIPALNTQMLVNKARRYDIPARFVTLQMMGFVAGDAAGPVTPGDAARRFETVSAAKSGEYLSVPDLTDGTVYTDEYVSYLTNVYGLASAGGINGYFLDYEPERWQQNHPVLDLPALTAETLVGKSAETAAAVKRIDRSALVLGPCVSGLGAYVNLNNQPDRDGYADSYSWFIDYYLDGLKKASDGAGVRLLDVLDLHYVTEANDSLNEPVVTGNTVFSNEARMQAPRLLWDGSYNENSVSAIRHKQHTPVIPTVLASVRMYYPGTKLSFSEYNFGGGSHISGAIAQADALGIFATYGVYMACAAPNTAEFPFQKSAINLYTNYDGDGSSFGDTRVGANNGGDVMSSVYAAINGWDASTLKAVLINKNGETEKRADVKIDSGVTFDSATVYSISGRSFEIRRAGVVTDIENNAFTYVLEPLTVYLFVFGAGGGIASVPPQIVTASETSPPETFPPSAAADTEASFASDSSVTRTAEITASVGTVFTEAATGNGDGTVLSEGDDGYAVPLPLKIIAGTLAGGAVLGVIYVFATDSLFTSRKGGGHEKDGD
jgi:hypothetical protein